MVINHLTLNCSYLNINMHENYKGFTTFIALTASKAYIAFNAFKPFILYLRKTNLSHYETT